MGLPGKAIEKIREAIKSAFTGRDKLVMMLRTQLDIEESDIPNHSDYNQVVFDLIIKLEREERVPDLIKGVLKEVPGNLELQNLPEILIRLLNKNDDKLTKIYREINIVFLYIILFNLASANKNYINQIKQIYSNCCSEKLYEDWEDTIANTVAEILSNLEKMSQNSEMEPIIQFAACLLERLLQQEKNSNPKIEKLKTWVQNNANNYSELLTKNHRNNTINNAAETIERYLIILIEPSLQETDNSLYIVKSWVIEGEYLRYKSLDITYQKKEKFSFEEIPGLLSYFIEQSIQHLKNLPTTIEFFLPYELFHKPIDAFIPQELEEEDDDDAELQIPVGIKYKVNIRSYQRIKKLLKKKYPDEKILLWKNKWNTLHSNREDICCTYLTSADNLQEIIRELFSDNVIGVKSSQIPSKDILKAIDQSGTPIALWLRTESKNLDFSTDFEAFLQDCSITELPKRIKDKRLEAFTQEIHIGKHITLLWDNPNILPPEVLPASLPEVLH